MIIKFHPQNKEEVTEIITKLALEYPEHVREPRRLFQIIQMIKADGVTMYVEEDYVDRQYRDSYYTYFSQKYGEYKKNCIRLAFFSKHLNPSDFRNYKKKIEKFFVGVIVLRPLRVGNIGQTLLNPAKLNVEGYVRTGWYRTIILGRKLKITAFPFSSQDDESITCAENALFNLMHYYSHKYSEYRLLMPSDILKYVEEAGYERVLPSSGISEANLARVLSKAHFYPRLYHWTDKNNDFNEFLYSYIESGIPLLLSIPNHVVTCIGHGCCQQYDKGSLLKNVTPVKIEKEVEDDVAIGKEAEDENPIEKDYVETYYLSTATLFPDIIVMDDNKTPYYKTNLKDVVLEYSDTDDINVNEMTEDSLDKKMKEELKKAALIVPLYKRIFTDVANARAIFETLFLQKEAFLKRIREAYNDLTWGLEKKNPIVYRMFLTASRSYKSFKGMYSIDKNLKDFYMECHLPRFIWIMEIGTLDSFEKEMARVEITLDATSSIASKNSSILSIRYKHHFLYVPDDVMDLESELLEEFLQRCEKKGVVGGNDEFWDEFDDQVKNKQLTFIYDLLYNIPDTTIEGEFPIYKGANLKNSCMMDGSSVFKNA